MNFLTEWNPYATNYKMNFTNTHCFRLVKVNFALASIRDTGTKYKVLEHPADLKLLKQCLAASGKEDPDN
ncbi:MAG: hypothetical protein IPL53_18545 [Ignavibacteria bacterium]|nr:hypothetical protein [Ignavibacteria bacterium]